MFGFMFGTACLVGIAALVHGHCHSRGRCHRGFHPFHHATWRHRGPRPWLYILSDELDLSPGQEKAVRAASDRFFEAVRPLRAEARQSRDDVARTLRSDLFDPTSLASVFARHDEALGVLRIAVTQLAQSLHEVLEPKQRERLADWIECHRPSWGHPYRTAC